MDRGLLIIVPTSDLQTAADVVAAARGLRTTVLSGTVTGREVLDHLARDQYSIVHFGGHGDGVSIQLSDGLLRDDDVLTALRGAHVEMIVLNSCCSIRLAVELYRAGAAPRVIGWRDSVTDDAATRWAGEFYRLLALGADYSDAFVRSLGALTGDEPPMLLNGRIPALEIDVLEMRTAINNLQQRFARMHITLMTLIIVLTAAILILS